MANWSTFFTQLLAAFGIYSPIDRPVVQPVISPINDNPFNPGSDDSSIIFVDDCDDDLEDLVKESLLKCGLSIELLDMLSTKIIGGSDTLINENPWQLSLQRRSAFGFSHFCGGSLIHPQWVITAAHCLEW